MTNWLGARATACAAGLLFAAGIAAAADEKTYPGTFCQPGYDPNGDVGYKVNGRINNNGSSSVTVDCPVVRDHVSNTNGLIDWLVRMKDGSSSAGVTCTLYARGKFGQLDDSLQLATTSGTGDFEHGTWGFLNSSSADGTYVMICSLPHDSGVYGYHVIERQQTD